MTTKRNLPHKLRESANTLGRQQTHEIPVMVWFCARLREELREAAEEIERLQKVEAAAQTLSLQMRDDVLAK